MRDSGIVHLQNWLIAIDFAPIIILWESHYLSMSLSVSIHLSYSYDNLMQDKLGASNTLKSF